MAADPALVIRAVDSFLTDLASARALSTAFEIGLVDALEEGPPLDRTPLDRTQLGSRLGLDDTGTGLLVDLLLQAGVLEETHRGVGLAKGFEAALASRDLLEARLEMALFAAPDVAIGFTDLVRAPDRFVEHARTFRLFDYARCVETDREALAQARRWVSYTTALTRYEAPACIERFPLAEHRALLDIGGNSGEFALQMCRAHSGLRATVLDLPAVCAVGRDHLAEQPESDRVRFVAGDAFSDPLPEGHDLVGFKSVLHDWPDDLAAQLLERAMAAVAPGGRILIFERGPLALRDGRLAFSMLPLLVFARYYRGPDLYEELLRGAGFEVDLQWLALDSPFLLITARRPA